MFRSNSLASLALTAAGALFLTTVSLAAVAPADPTQAPTQDRFALAPVKAIANG